MLALALLVLSLTPQVSVSQTVRDLQSFFREDVGLSEEQIANIRGGKAVVKAMPSRTPDEVFLFGSSLHPRGSGELCHIAPRFRSPPWAAELSRSRCVQQSSAVVRSERFQL